MKQNWGVLDKEGQWIDYYVTEYEARDTWKQTPDVWKLVKNIETDEISGTESYEIVEEIDLEEEDEREETN